MTKAEEAFQAKVRRLGCIVCHNEGFYDVPVDLHHMLRGGRRIGEEAVLPLCHNHHGAGLNNAAVTSRHPWRKAFEARYGSEAKLLRQVREMLG